MQQISNFEKIVEGNEEKEKNLVNKIVEKEELKSCKLERKRKKNWNL